MIFLVLSYFWDHWEGKPKWYACFVKYKTVCKPTDCLRAQTNPFTKDRQPCFVTKKPECFCPDLSFLKVYILLRVNNFKVKKFCRYVLPSFITTVSVAYIVNLLVHSKSFTGSRFSLCLLRKSSLLFFMSSSKKLSPALPSLMGHWSKLNLGT